MMNVSEYAKDVKRQVNEILALCKKLDIKVTKEEDMLDDEAIILLDNEIANIEEIEDEEEITDSYEDELEEIQITATINKKKKKSQVDFKKNDYDKKKKEMYKHKEKLQSNITSLDDNMALYTEGMTVLELANTLGVSLTEVIKKFMSLGMMMTINTSVDCLIKN